MDGSGSSVCSNIVVRQLKTPSPRDSTNMQYNDASVTDITVNIPDCARIISISNDDKK